ncbi:MAG: tetratricopeptide repeat protein [Phycisphaerales bacterium]
MYIFLLFSMLALFFSSLCSAQTTPNLITDDDHVDVVADISSQLLTDARTRKATGKSGYGSQYRRAAWAAIDESPTGDIAQAIAILHELLDDSESVFDTFDAYRMMGQIYFSKSDFENATLNYETGMSIATADPRLVDAHPMLFASIANGLSITSSALGDYPKALEYAIILRDHPSQSLSRKTKRIAAYSALNYALKSNNKSNYNEAWEILESRFPERTQGREGVSILHKHAIDLASFDGQIRDHLEEIWSREGVREYDTCISVALSLSDSWRSQTALEDNKLFSHLVLAEAWNSIEQFEQTWLDSAHDNPVRTTRINHHTKTLLVRLIESSIELNLPTEALLYTQLFIDRYSPTDTRGEAWMQMIATLE